MIQSSLFSYTSQYYTHAVAYIDSVIRSMKQEWISLKLMTVCLIAEAMKKNIRSCYCPAETIGMNM